MTRKLLTILLLMSLNAWSQDVLIDPRDGNQYQVVQIGDYRWFKSNLRYQTPTSWCAQYHDAEPCDESNFYFYTDLESLCPPSWHVQ